MDDLTTVVFLTQMRCINCILAAVKYIIGHNEKTASP